MILDPFYLRRRFDSSIPSLFILIHVLWVVSWLQSSTHSSYSTSTSIRSTTSFSSLTSTSSSSFTVVAFTHTSPTFTWSSIRTRSSLNIPPPITNKISSFLSHTKSTKITVIPLFMSDSGRNSGGGGGGGATEKIKKTKKGLSTIVLDKTETKSAQKEDKEEEWRVVLHNDEVHTFNYVIQSLCKVIQTMDRKRAFDVCVLTHGTGKATITKTWKAQAMKYCLGLQRQGLTASIAPESRFSGGSGGDDGDGGGGGDGGGDGSGSG